MVNQSDLEKYIGTKPPLSSIKKMDNSKLIKVITSKSKTTTKKKPVVKKPVSKSKAYIKGKEALKRLRKRN